MKKYSRNQLGSLTILVVAMMQAGVVHAGNSSPGLQLNTGIAVNPALGGACVGSTNPSVSGTSTCNVSVPAPNTVTITSGNLTANAPNMAGILITGDTSVTNTVNFSGTATTATGGSSSSAGVNIANTAGHITFNVTSGSTIAVANAATGTAGGAGVTGNSFTLGNAGSITGGAGGNGVSGGMFGGAGGAGAAGVSGSGFTVNNSGSITGGTGGVGGFGIPFGGTGGAGAAGVSGSGFTVNNSGSITGGAGGSGMFIGAAGGAAVTSTGGSTVNNSGTITGGFSGLGPRGNAVSFSGGANKLVLDAGSVIIGNAVSTSGATNGGDTLALGGNVNAVGNTFDLASIGSIAQYQGFQNFAKEGTSLWTLTGTGTSSWSVTAGTLHLADGLALTGDVNMASGATISSDNAGITGQLTNGGTVSVAASKTLTVGAFTNTGTFSPVVTDSGYGKIFVTGGVAILTGSTLAVDASTMTGANTYHGVVSSIIHANTIGGTFASFSDNSALFNFTPVYTATDVNLTIAAASHSGVFDAVTANGNKSAEGAAHALDAIISANPGGQIAAVFIPVAANDVSNAASQTVPLIAGAVSQSIINNLSGVTHIVQSRQEGQYGKSSGDNFYGDKNFWFKPFGSWADQDSRNGVSGYKADSYGMIFGIDGTLSDVNRVGLAFAYSKTNIDSTGVASQSADVDSYTAIAYGSHSLSDTTELNFQGDIGLHDTNGTRNIDIGGANSRADSSYNSWSGHVGTGLAHTMTLSEKTAFTPSIRADYSYIRSNSYRENGAGVLNLNVDQATNEAFVVGIDGKVSHAINAKVALVANLGVGYDLINDQASLTSAFAGAPTVAFTTKGIDPSPWLARGGFGIVGRVSETTEISARYDFEVRDSFDNQTASVKVRWAF
jgi:outer membrane autotransporter protein